MGGAHFYLTTSVMILFSCKIIIIIIIIIVIIIIIIIVLILILILIIIIIIFIEGAQLAKAVLIGVLNLTL